MKALILVMLLGGMVQEETLVEKWRRRMVEAEKGQVLGGRVRDETGVERWTRRGLEAEGLWSWTWPGMIQEIGGLEREVKALEKRVKELEERLRELEGKR